MATFSVTPTCPYDLDASRDFLRGFTPAADSAVGEEKRLTLAFRLERSWEPVAVTLAQRDGAVHGSVIGTKKVEAAKQQALRMLSLDHDASGWLALGRREEPIGALQAAHPGFLPVCFASPYEAALWGLLAHRINMKQAAGIKRRLAEAHGDALRAGEHVINAVPSPEKVLALDCFAGIPEVKWRRLRGAARAALDGLLDSARLRAMEHDEAIAALMELEGVGSWTAEHILMRGCGLVDHLPLGEPRVLRGAALAYGLEAELPDERAFLALGERWKPYRSWVSVLLAFHLARTAQWNGPGKRGGRPAPKRKAPSKQKALPLG